MPDSIKHRVYLIPGFFGFANLGELVYFGPVKTFLEAEIRRRGLDADIITVPSHPTASVRTRALDLLDTLEATAGESGPLHFIGHSTGGLDARLLLTPAVDLGGGRSPAAFANRTQTLVTVATPHYGTPLASFFNSFFGSKMLEVLSLFTVYVLRFGRVPLPLLFRIAGTMLRLDRKLGWKDTVLDQLFDELLSNFSEDRRHALSAFFDDVRKDRSLVPQLTPENMDLFNPGVTDRVGVKYGSVVTRALAPSPASFFKIGLGPYTQVSHAVYAFLYGRAAMFPLDRAPPPTAAQAQVLVRGLGSLMPLTANDGIVPTRSQVHGQVLRAVKADHLDVIGHFDGPDDRPPHVDWLFSGSAFKHNDFVSVWSDIADFCLGRVSGP